MKRQRKKKDDRKVNYLYFGTILKVDEYNKFKSFRCS